MKKLRLQAEDLAVDSFRTAEEDAAWRGTVDGHGATPAVVCNATATIKTQLTCCPCTPAY